MTPDLHPHWQSTDAEVPIHTKGPTGTMHTRRLSRRPAAMVGIALVLAGVLPFFRESQDDLAGQLSSEATIQITDDGMQPETVFVTPGATITWINSQDLPHILVSETLCAAPDDCLETEPIFAGASIQYQITGAAAPGEHRYVSTIDEALAGTIVVGDMNEATDVLDLLGGLPDSDTESEANSTGESDSFADTVATVTSILGASDSPPPPPVIPQNIHTSPLPVVQASALHAGAPRPIRQPSTGPEEWVVLLGSMAALLWITRGLWKKGLVQ